MNYNYAQAPYHQYAYPQQLSYGQPVPVPQYSAYQAPMVAPPAVQVPDRRIYNKKLSYKLGEDANNNKYVEINNIEVPSAVNLMCSSMPFKRCEPMMDGSMRFGFNPDGRAHDVTILNYRKPVMSFKLVPRQPEVKTLKNAGQKLMIENLYDKNSLELLCDKDIEWNLQEHPDRKHTYYLNFEAFNNEASIELKSRDANGKKMLLKNGKFDIAPKNPNAYRGRYAYPQELAYAYPQAMYYPPAPMYAPNRMIGRG